MIVAARNARVYVMVGGHPDVMDGNSLFYITFNEYFLHN